MLIDDLLAPKAFIDNLEKPAPRAAILARLRKAQKFVLGPDFAAVADDLATDFTALSKAIEFIHLPFPETWVEVAQSHRPYFNAADIHLPIVQSRPTRIGFLLTADGLRQGLASFKAHQFWKLPPRPVPQEVVEAGMGEELRPVYENGYMACSHLAMQFTPEQARADIDTTNLEGSRRDWVVTEGPIQESPMWKAASPKVRSLLTSVIQPCPTDFPTVIDRAMAEGDIRTARVSYEIGVIDWSGEAIFILAVLALLNARNTADRVTVTPSSKHLKHCQKVGKTPPQDHYLLTISARLKQRLPVPKGDGEHRYLRGTFVRGHIKKRKSGLFFWSPHLRGDPKNMVGRVGYELHA